MVWGAIHFYDVGHLAFLEGRRNSVASSSTLELHLLAWVAKTFGKTTE